MKSYSNFDTSAFNCTSRSKWILFCAGLQHSYRVNTLFHFLLLWKKTYPNFDTGAFNCTSESNEYYISLLCRLQHIEIKCRLHVCCSIEETVSCLEQRLITEITPPNINVVTQWRNSFLYVPKVPEMCRVTVASWRAYTFLVKSFTGTTAFIQYIPVEVETDCRSHQRVCRGVSCV